VGVLSITSKYAYVKGFEIVTVLMKGNMPRDPISAYGRVEGVNGAGGRLYFRRVQAASGRHIFWKSRQRTTRRRHEWERKK